MSSHSSEPPQDEAKQCQVKVCTGPRCDKNFSKYTLERAERELAKNPKDNITLGACPCQGNCQRGVTVTTEKNGEKTLHSFVDPITMAKLIDKLS